MCGRFYIQSMDIDELRKIIEEIERHSKEMGVDSKVKLGEIFPTDIVPVIANDRNGTPTPSLMRWGFTKPDGKGVIINARSETVFEKALFRSAVTSHRCLVPAVNYFEWLKKGSQRVKYEIKTEDEPIIFMAAIYRFEKSSNVPVFTILTKAPAENIKFIHDRMPVLVPRELHMEWLASGGDPQKVLLQGANTRVMYQEIKEETKGPVQTTFL